MASKKAKVSSDKSADKSAIKAQPKAEAAGPAEESTAAPAKPAPKPPVPPRPVPPHQQFAAKGMKPQHMAKARMIRHQGR